MPRPALAIGGVGVAVVLAELLLMAVMRVPVHAGADGLPCAAILLRGFRLVGWAPRLQQCACLGQLQGASGAHSTAVLFAKLLWTPTHC